MKKQKVKTAVLKSRAHQIPD